MYVKGKRGRGRTEGRKEGRKIRDGSERRRGKNRVGRDLAGGRRVGREERKGERFKRYQGRNVRKCNAVAFRRREGKSGHI